MKYNKEELENLILVKNIPYVKIGKIYGVTGNSIKKAAIKLGINIPKRRIINKCESFSHKKSMIYKLSENDFISIIQSSKNIRDALIKIGYSKSSRFGKKTVSILIKRCNELGINIPKREIQKYRNQSSELITKGELIKRCSSYQSYRGIIGKSARNKFFSINKECKCAICGYDKHVEIAHIKPVSDFNNEILISEINDINNLIALCPNHHWEYDNGLIKL